jgi:1-aminocyclopropane-1-carboxylate deaminase/D-cysteine desulfhydrase-like pyridoxal-dependent ACC family enzyme
VAANSAALERLAAIPRLSLAPAATPVEELSRLRDALGFDGTLLVKRDDAIPFGFGGNKVRKLQIVAAQAMAEGADTLITTGGIQSNHARATAAVAARLGLGCVLVANGTPPAKPTANALLDRLLGAEVRHVASRDARAPAMEDAAEELRKKGRRPFVIPLGASTPFGAAAYALAVTELLAQIHPPDLIVLSTSSGGTQAGLIAGCRLHGLSTRILGVSADDPSAAIATEVRRILTGLETLLELTAGSLAEAPIDVDDRFVGDGYGIPTAQSTEAIEVSARREAVFLDPTYTAKAMAGLIARARAGDLDRGTTLFWHTGGQVGLFA